ncbi:unnamed protein product [Hapterophycus canaliculatus]
MIIPPAVLAELFDLVNKVHGGLLDAKTKQLLLRPEALEAAKRLREHIVADCCSDAPKQAPYFKTGKDPETLCALFHCVRDMNDLEGYHFHGAYWLHGACRPDLPVSSFSSTIVGGIYVRG